jgi:hypothetical protein
VRGFYCAKFVVLTAVLWDVKLCRWFSGLIFFRIWCIDGLPKTRCESLRYGVCESSLCLSDLAAFKVELGCVGSYFMLSNHWMFRIPCLINTETSGSAEKRFACDVVSQEKRRTLWNRKVHYCVQKT